MHPILIIREFSQSNPSHFFELGQTLFFSVRKCRTRNLSNRRRAIFVCFLKLSRPGFKIKISRQNCKPKNFFRNKANWINKTSRRGIESPVVMLKRIKMCFAEFFKTEIYSRSGNEKSRIKTGISSNSKSKSKPPLIKNLSPKQWIFFWYFAF